MDISHTASSSRQHQFRAKDYSLLSKDARGGYSFEPEDEAEWTDSNPDDGSCSESEGNFDFPWLERPAAKSDDAFVEEPAGAGHHVHPSGRLQDPYLTGRASRSTTLPTRRSATGDHQFQGRQQNANVDPDITEKQLIEKIKAFAEEERKHEDRRNTSPTEDGDRDSDADDPSGESDDDDDRDHRRGKTHSGETFFGDYTKSLTKAQLLFYLNSGCARFLKHRDYMKSYDGTPVDFDELIDEVRQERITEEESYDLAQRFLKRHDYTGERLMSCGCCGMRMHEVSAGSRLTYTPLFLDEPCARPLQYGSVGGELEQLKRTIDDPASTVEIPVDSDWTMARVQVWKLRSIYTQETEDGSVRYWHLHPEMVERDVSGKEYTYVCPTCNGSLRKKKKGLTAKQRRPKYSIASGIDFGYYKRLGLTMPNLLETQILSRTRMFFAAMKVSSNTQGVVNGVLHNRYKCHAILFPHDAQKVAAYMYNPDVYGPNGILDPEGLEGMMQIYMVDYKGRVDTLFRHIFGTSVVSARPWLVAQWLIIMKYSNPFCKDLDLGQVDLVKERIKTCIDGLNQSLKKKAVHAVNPDVVAFEQKLGADITEAMHREIVEDEEICEREQEAAEAMSRNSSLPISVDQAVAYSYVTPTEQGYLVQEPEHDFRAQTLQRLANLDDDAVRRAGETDKIFKDTIFDQKEEVNQYLHKFPPSMQRMSARGKDPYSDFSNDDLGLATCFPHVFTLGKAYHKVPGRLSQEEKLHMLCQFTMVPSSDRRLLGFFFDMMQRMKVFDGVKAYVDGNAKALREIKKLIEDPMERALLKMALQTPNSERSKRLLERYYCHLRCAGKRVSYGAVEGSLLKQQMAGLSNRFGAVGTFLTLSAASMDDPRAIRCTFHSKNNTSFPSVFEPGCSYGEDGTEFLTRFNIEDPAAEGVISIPYETRACRAVEDPVSFVMQNKLLLHDILALLIGIPPDDSGFFAKSMGSSRRKSFFYKSLRGAFGSPLYYCGVTEDHKRGTLHWHVNIASGCSDHLLQRFSNLSEVCDEVSKTLDSMYRSELTPKTHVASLAHRCLAKKRISWELSKSVAASLHPKSIMSSRAGIYKKVKSSPATRQLIRSINATIDRQGGFHNSHQHKSRCYKEPKGSIGCALDQPQGCVSQTAPRLLVPIDNASGTSQDETGSGSSDETPGETAGPNIPIVFQIEGLPEETFPTGEAGDPNECCVPYEVRTMGSESRMDNPPKHELKNLLTRKKDADLVVWETKRPVILSADFSVDLRTVPDEKAHVIQAFRRVLGSGGDAPHSETEYKAFWDWLETSSTEEQRGVLFNYIRVKLPMANGYVATFNPVISFCTSAHNNSCVLGSMTNAKSAMYYLIPYEAKPKVRPEQCIPILEDTIQYIDKPENLSKADDKYTISRTVKHFLQRTLNRLHLKVEVSDYQVSAALLGLPSTFTSEEFAYANPIALSNLEGQMALSDNSGEAFTSLCGEISAADKHARERNSEIREAWRGPAGNETRALELLIGRREAADAMATATAGDSSGEGRKNKRQATICPMTSTRRSRPEGERTGEESIRPAGSVAFGQEYQTRGNPKRFHVTFPPGKFGFLLEGEDNGPKRIREVLAHCRKKNKVRAGDMLISIRSWSVEDKTLEQVTSLLSSLSDQYCTLKFSRERDQDGDGVSDLVHAIEPDRLADAGAAQGEERCPAVRSPAPTATRDDPTVTADNRQEGVSETINKTFHVTFPPGRLGLFIQGEDSGPKIVKEVLAHCKKKKSLRAGDVLLAVRDWSVADKTMEEVKTHLSSMSQQTRTLRFLRREKEDNRGREQTSVQQRNSTGPARGGRGRDLTRNRAAQDEHRAYVRFAVAKELGQIVEATVTRMEDDEEVFQTILFPKTAYYFYRGESLFDVTYYEYTALIDVKKRKPPDTCSPLNPRSARSFAFHKEFVYGAEAYQTLRRKHCTPLPMGSKPKYPGNKPVSDGSLTGEANMKAWEFKANEYARYYLAYFRPYKPGEGTSWIDLEAYIARLQESTRVIDTFRLVIMDQHMQGMWVPSTCVAISRHFRSRCRDRWSAKEKIRRALEKARENKMRRNLSAFEEQTDCFLDARTKSRTMASWEKQIDHDKMQMRSLRRFSDKVEFSKRNTPGARKKWYSAVSRKASHRIADLVSKMSQWKPSKTLDIITERNNKRTYTSRRDAARACQEEINKLKKGDNTSSTQQTKILDLYKEHLVFGSARASRQPPRILLLHGPPGVGKTATRDCLLEMAKICDTCVLKISFNAINAAEMGGETTCTYIGVDSKKHMEEVGTFSKDVLQRLEDVGFNKDSILTIEEFETNAPWHLARLHRLCQMKNGNNEPFGGCLVVLIGDLGQLSPVKAGLNLSQAVMDVNLDRDLKPRSRKRKRETSETGSDKKNHADPTLLPGRGRDDARFRFDHPHAIGAGLMTQARWYELTEQQRSIDPVHTRVVTKTYRMEPINFDRDLKSNGYKLLSEADATNEVWLRAPALVACNRERYSLSLQRAVDLARFLGQPVIRWMSHYDRCRWKNKPVNNEDELDALSDPCFYELFVEGSDGYLKDSYMRHLRLVNGTRIKYHSLVFEDQYKDVVKEHLQRAEPGEVVTFPFAPVAVVVEVIMPEQTEREVLDALRSFSVSTHRRPEEQPILIPIYPFAGKWSNRPVPVYGGLGYEPSSVYLRTVFPLEPAFAITIHKALGRTLDRVILAISHNSAPGCSIEYRQLHVALSRVKEREHIRFLLKGNDESSQWQSLTYLESLKPDPSVGYYLAGFRPYDKDDPNREDYWRDNSWSASRANEWYRQNM